MAEVTEQQRKEFEEKLKNMSPEELAEFQKQQCIFCQIIAGKIPAKTIFEDEKCIVALDINPATKGHLILIPKEHYMILPQVPDEDIGHFFTVARYLSQLLLKTLKLEGTNIFVANGAAAGQKAQHFLIHIIPRSLGDGVFQIEEKFIDEELRAKVKIAMQDHLAKHLGIEVQTTLPEPEASQEPEEVAQDEPEQPEEITQEDQQEQDLEEDEHDQEEQEAQDDEQDEPQEEEGNNASLDDIANLFK